MRPRPKKQNDRLGGRAVLVVVLVLAVLVGGGWLAAYELAGDKLPHGASAAGIDVGDKTPDEAARALTAGLAERISRPISVRVGAKTVSVDPAGAGLSVDAAATVAGGAGVRSWNPVDLWNHYTDGSDLEPVVRVDDAKLARAARHIDAAAGTAAKDGTVRFVGNRVVVTDPVPGRAVDVGQLESALRAAYLSSGDRTVVVTLHDVRPRIDEDAVQKAVDEFANPAMTGPVKLVVGTSPVLLMPRQYARAIRLVPRDGELKPVVDTVTLRAVLDRVLAAYAASRRLVKGKPKVIPAKRVVSYDPKEVGRVLLEVVTRPAEERVGRVTAAVG